MRNILSIFQNLMSLKQVTTGYANLVGDKSLPTSRTEPEPELRTGKNRFFSVNPIRTWTV